MVFCFQRVESLSDSPYLGTRRNQLDGALGWDESNCQTLAALAPFQKSNKTTGRSKIVVDSPGLQLC